MPKNETGEFELVLGNRQLLSGFAVVVILLGVFFAMGYIVGRNSMPSTRVAAADSSAAPTQAEASRTQAVASAGAPASTTETAATAAPPVVDTPPVAPTQAARAPEEAKPAAKAVDTPAPSVQTSESLQPGTYLQVIATIKSDAEVISKSLQDRKFPAVITPSSLEGRFRVLVGPYSNATAVGGAKSELENLGFHPIAVKMAEKN